MIEDLVTAITALVIGVVALWSFSPRFRAHIERPKHDALGRAEDFAQRYPSVATNPPTPTHDAAAVAVATSASAADDRSTVATVDASDR